MYTKSSLVKWHVIIPRYLLTIKFEMPAYKQIVSANLCHSQQYTCSLCRALNQSLQAEHIN